VEIIREIRDIDSGQIIIDVPRGFKSKRVEILILPIDLRETENTGDKVSRKESPPGSGLCGLWEDERTPEEILSDIYSHRTGFAHRLVTL